MGELGVHSLGLHRTEGSQGKGLEQKRVRLQVPKNNIHLCLAGDPQDKPKLEVSVCRAPILFFSHTEDARSRYMAFRPNAQVKSHLPTGKFFSNRVWIQVGFGVLGSSGHSVTSSALRSESSQPDQDHGDFLTSGNIPFIPSATAVVSFLFLLQLSFPPSHHCNQCPVQDASV